MNRFAKIGIILLEFILCYVIFAKGIIIECVFKKIFNISCFSCGITRGFKEIINFNFVESFNYNWLSIPIFILIIYINILLINDIIFNSKKINSFFDLLGQHYKIIILIIIINTIINNVRGI